MAKVIKLRRSESGWSHREQTSFVQPQLQEDSNISLPPILALSPILKIVFNTSVTTVHCTKTTKKTCWREKIMLRCCTYMYFRILINLAASFRFPWETLGCDSTSAFWACDVPGRRVRFCFTEKKSTENQIFYSRWLLWAGRREGGSLALGPRGDYNHGGGGQHHHHHYHPTMEEEINIIIIIIDVIIITI